MADYFLCLDAETFLNRIQPAFADSWRKRNFDPCRSLCLNLLPAAQAYIDRYHTGEDESLVARVAGGIPFDRACWRHLVGEVLLFAAVEIPEFQSNAETLCCLLDRRDAGPTGGVGGTGVSPVQSRHQAMVREQLAPIGQVFRGSRDVTFGAAVYRPDEAGYNDPGDVARLAAYLAAVEPQRWTVDDLLPQDDLTDDEERADELAFVREWFPVLVELYQRTQEQRRVLVIENIY